jgi:pimeloyl-ACP methyl ester carboxylesterase
MINSGRTPVGLLDVLDRTAHLVDASLGAMVAQTIAIAYPARVRSLTSMLSITGDRAVGQERRRGARPGTAAPRPPAQPARS